MQAIGSLITDATTAHDLKFDLVLRILRGAGAVKIRALGTSMLPTIWPGDILKIEAASGDDITCGDVIAVHAKDGVRAHRLLHTDGPHWVTRGDAMPQNDPAVSPKHVLGRISEIRRGQQIITPRRELHFLGRAVARLLSYSLICRVVVHLHSKWLNRTPQSGASQLCNQNPVP